MPITSIPWRRNETAAVEITALAAGAGPPANRMATRRKGVVGFGGGERLLVIALPALGEVPGSAAADHAARAKTWPGMPAILIPPGKISNMALWRGMPHELNV